MLNFLVQKIGGKLVHDFAFELTQAKDFYEWFGRDELDITFLNTTGITTIADDFGFIDNPDVFIPVGSVEFVSEYLKKFYPGSEAALAPINVPIQLFQFANRKIVNVHTESDMDMFKDVDYLLFKKSLTRIKHPDNGMFDKKFTRNYLENQVSEIIDVKSEWRVFVFKNEIMHISNYSGDSLLFPNPDKIREMVETYKGHCPVAYTLDVCVGTDLYNKKEFITSVLEVHRFFSCGLYGFSEHNRIPKMLSQTWYEMKTNKKL